MTSVDAVQVVRPDGTTFVSLDPIGVLDVRYPWASGYTLHPVRGRHSTYGFAVFAGQGAI